MTNVPSNLIPTRVTQLPVAPVADPDSLMMIVYQGNNYQIRVGDLLSVAGVPITTQVIAGTGMSGGGALSGNVTLSVAVGGIGTTQLANSGVTAGVYGTATDIPVFTVDATGRVMSATTIPATISGYVPTTRQVIAGTGLTGGGALSANVTLAADLSSSTPLTGFQSGSAGSATTMSRSDHTHPQVDLSDDDQVDNLLGLNNGGTAKSLVAAAGAIVWSGADGLYIGPVGLAGQVLVSGGAGAPTWGSALLVVDQAANVVYAGPTAGPAAPTSFRALVNADLPASGVSANTYGSSSLIPILTVNAQGVVTNASTTAFSSGSVTSVDVSGGTTGLTTSGGPVTTSGTITIAGTLAIASGGSGQTTASAAFNALSPVTTTGDLILGTGVNTASRLGIGSNGYLLTSNGTTASWAAAPAGGVTSVASTFTGGIVGVAGSPITSTGTLAYTVAGTSGGIPYFSSGTTWATSAALTQYGVVYGGGAGAAPVATAAGTAGYALIANSAAAPTFQQVSLSTGVTGTLPVLNGGTGAVNATDARTNLVAAKSGTNSDITELYALNGTAGGVAYQNVSNQLIMGSALTFDGTVLQVPGGISGGTF